MTDLGPIGTLGEVGGASELCCFAGSFHADRTKDLYRDLLSVFDKLVLPTHASSHVQYSMFYLCSFKLVGNWDRTTAGNQNQTSGCVLFWFQALAEAFLDHLWKILQNPAQPAVLRQAAAGYLGSFLARAKFVPVP